MIDIADISARTGIPPRRFRYILEEGLVPFARRFRRAGAKGRVRAFTPGQAFELALVALLADLGLRRSAISQFVRPLVAGQGGLSAAVEPGDRPPARHVLFEFADGVNFRFNLGPRRDGRPDDDDARRPAPSPWYQLATKAPLDASYQPTAVLSVDVTVLRARLAPLAKTAVAVERVPRFGG